MNKGEYNNISCAIMAGGKNSRMGRHKAFLKYRGRYLIDIVRKNMHPWFDNIFIVTNDKCQFSEHYAPVYEDIIPDLGPMGALYTALIVSGSEYVFCVACDMPYPNNHLISRILNADHDSLYDCIVPQGELGFEPLFALYRTSLANLLEDEIALNQLQISGIYNKCHTKYIDIRNAEREIININTPEDYLHLTGQNLNLCEDLVCHKVENEQS